MIVILHYWHKIALDIVLFKFRPAQNRLGAYGVVWLPERLELDAADFDTIKVFNNNSTVGAAISISAYASFDNFEAAREFSAKFHRNFRNSQFF